MIEKTPSTFEAPHLSVDSVLFTIEDKALKTLLIKRPISPFKGSWSLPGGYVDISKDESSEQTASRKLREKTGVTPPYLEQLQSFANKSRDPRGWSATIAYFALMPYKEPTSHDEAHAQWVNVNELSGYQTLAFDHAEILQLALERLQQKALYSMLPVFCLPEEFTLSEYHQLIEIILDKKIQKKSLYRRFEASNMFEETGRTVATGARAAMLYRLKEDVELVNFERNLG